MFACYLYEVLQVGEFMSQSWVYLQALKADGSVVAWGDAVYGGDAEEAFSTGSATLFMAFSAG